jgi:S1-C subfamily serine protease
MKRIVVVVVWTVLTATATRADSIAEVYKRVAGSVVVVRTTETGSSGIGSGVLVSADGNVLTAAHVVQVAETVLVELPGGETLGAKVVASEPSADLAMLKLERPPSKPVVAVLGDSDAVEVGDEVFVVGAPLGMTHSLTFGHISGRRIVNDLFGGFEPAELFQTDAAINAGNSGGPMFDREGHVIGIVSHLLSTSEGAGGLGFVATSAMAKKLLIDNPARWSGMEGYMLSGGLARIFQLPQSRGILVQRVASRSPAAKLGIVPGTEKATIGEDSFLVGGDVILSVQGISIADEDSGPRIREALAARKPGQPVSVIVLRGGRRLELQGVPER